MSVDKYKFISPGVFTHEIDNTGRNAIPEDIGPALIGRAEKGPILKPTRVNSYAEFVTAFGNPIPGGRGGDVARDGNYTSPTYAAYAAQAWFRNNSPITYVRLGGQASANADVPEGQAGWQTSRITPSASLDSNVGNGGAYGLFVAQSGSAGVTGSLAAVWYLDQQLVIGLSGTMFSSSVAGTQAVGTGIYIESVGDRAFKVQITGSDGIVVDTRFDFDSTSETFIRKVFNTNPILSNNAATDATSTTLTRYWLGESFEGNILNGPNALPAGTAVGVILPLLSGNTRGGDFRQDYQNAQTGWFFSQDVTTNTGSYSPANMQRLFRFVARNSGDWAARNLKVSIQDLKRSSDPFNKYGSFTVALRAMSDTDNRVEYVEQFNNCNLNPNSEHFVARKIGDKFVEWADEDRRYRELGDYPNASQYIRIDMNKAVGKGDIDAEFLPWGIEGPLRFDSFQDLTANENPSFVSGNFDDYGASISTFISGATDGRIKFDFPQLRLRISSSEGSPTDPRDSYFGVDTTFNSSRFNESVLDLIKIKPNGVSDFNAEADLTSTSFFFTLDDMMSTGSINVYVSGSRADASLRPANLTYIRGSGSYSRILETAGVDRFTGVFNGGFDGLNIKESEPFRNLNDGDLVGTGGPDQNYTVNSVQVAIDSLRDPEVVEYNLAGMPGIKNNTLNRSLIDMCESRGDALAVIDLLEDYTPEYESTADAANRLPDVDQAVLNVRNNLQVNSSYGCAYFPWVQIRDSITGQFVWVPPSVVALGAISYGQRSSELWFAPAGFTRGGLSGGTAGLPVVSVRMRLTSKQRDTLYDANINPIAQFPAEGIVIFGQKTLQVTPSALDRINVRRLLIFLKRQISNFAATILFDQNVRTTWNRFRGVVEPFLSSVQARLGITDFRLILDETTTTPELVDRNILYAKIYIKPARAIEYIALDFILTDSGAAFED